MLRSTAIAFSVLLSACATSPVSIDKATPVPADRLIAFQDDSAGDAKITVIRDVGHMAGGCYLALTINGELAARFDTGEFAMFYLPAGEVLFKYGRDPEGRGLCGVNSDIWVKRESFLKQGDNKTFRLSVSSSGDLDVMRVN